MRAKNNALTVVVVGGVAGGASFSARARRMDEAAEIIMLDRGEHISFANCGLPYYISGEIDSKKKLLIQNPQRFSKRYRVDVRVRSEVIKIYRSEKTVEVINHETGEHYRQHYDKLVLSPGAAPLRPPLPGINHPRVFSLRTIEDAEQIKSCIQEMSGTANVASEDDTRKAVVVGGGFIGLEMAEVLKHQDYHVTIVEMADQVMLSLDREMAEFVQQHLDLQGVHLLLGKPVEGFSDSNDGRLAVSVRGRKPLFCDFAVTAIGVKPEIRLAEEAGLEKGDRGGIRVNEHLQTNDPDIYAIGDVIEMRNRITDEMQLVPLAGLANKQGRIAADHICGEPASFRGAFGTNIVRVFDLTVGSTGANEKMLAKNDIPYRKSYTHPSSHAGYYPGAAPMVMKLLLGYDTGKILGAQVVGVAGVERCLNVLAAALQSEMNVHDLTELELAYAPQYGTGKDAVNMAGYVGSNEVEGIVDLIFPEEVDESVNKGACLLDVRTRREFEKGHISGAVNIPIDEVRRRLGEIPTERLLLVYCLTGIRSYFVCRVLIQLGYQVRNLSGGYVMYCASRTAECKHIPGLEEWKRILALETFCTTLKEKSVP